MATIGAVPSRRGLLIAGGGTAGHIVPGLAVAAALTERGWPPDLIHFVGSARGIDADMIPPAGFGLTTLGGRGLNARRVNVSNAVAAAGLMWATLRGIALVGRRRPAAVLSLGGYASLPAALGAVVWRVPLVISEQNAVAASTNRLLARFAKAAAVPVEGTGLQREVVTGTPVRDEVVHAAGAATTARKRLGWPAEATVIVVFGGSLGSLRINSAVWKSLPQLADRDGIFIYHVVGHRDWPQRPPMPPQRGQGAFVRDWYHAVPYDEHLPVALAAADLAVCRAGASTVAELSVLGLHSVLVPLPVATKDHQRHNAASLVAAGLATMVLDAEFDSDRLVAEISGLVRAQSARTGSAEKGCALPGAADMPREVTFGRQDSARRVADLVVEHSAAVPDAMTPEDRKH